MMDGELPTRFGGMPSVAARPDRVDRLAAWILEADPDIFCGQELTLASGTALYEKLRSRYRHFWIGIGEEPGKKQSGLFFASKRTLRAPPVFVPFPEEEQLPSSCFLHQTRNLHRGFAYMDLGAFYLVNTHLEGGNLSLQEAECRARQLDRITREMDQLGKPYLLIGDLNIPRTGLPGDEYSSSRIPRDYEDPYTQTHPDVGPDTFTCTNIFTLLAAGEEKLPEEAHLLYEIDDYVLIRKPFRDHFGQFAVQLRHDSYNIERPREEQISDHKGFFASFEWID
jgi:endonuclease/exonuclease/phosphatase family metal-dependent hydrolase